ncbi:O-acetyl-ADP-ribose deacetylase MACROD1 [Hypsibius exemplaris]|uniref:O-acetyl-ADP-ribose deacetylase MACROD1 n=1 Tax=Hypsibius exemplaris TaxID=2072580 RepID=A0A1W0WYB1_HYPEX|nr:O-acetyl-ADP-ribose deacetylase MACROD1 [Hypsibius exemplaris]
MQQVLRRSLRMMANNSSRRKSGGEDGPKKTAPAPAPAAEYSTTGVDPLDIPCWTEHLKSLHIPTATNGEASSAAHTNGKALKHAVLDEEPVRQNFNDKISLWQGDITEFQADAIVNAANKSLLGGGGVDGAIHHAAGPDLRAECLKLHGCATGEAKITKGFRLPCKHVIHTVGPIGEKPEKLRSCYLNSLDLLKEHELRTVVFPCISTGIYGYPNEAACLVAIESVRHWLETGDNSSLVDRIIFCLYEDVDVDCYEKHLPTYFPPV